VTPHCHRYRASAADRLRTILAEEFSRRRRTNARYSLRAFARSVRLDHSTLSQLLHGKRPMTWKSIRHIAPSVRWIGASTLQIYKTRGGWDSRAIAAELGVSVDKVNVALSDLCLLGLMEMGKEAN